MKMRIAIDAMGGDYAPRETVKGAVLAAKEYTEDSDIILIGDKDAIRDRLSHEKTTFPDMEIINAPDLIQMHESPAKAIKNKPNSSISIGTKLQKSGEIDAFVSAGNTGVVYASALMNLKRIKGVRRPTIGAYLPAENKGTTIFDAGANPNCLPLHLLQFGIMGSIYVEHIFGWKNPSVGLLNIGVEASKGNEMALESFQLLSEFLPNFYGNVDGRDILVGKVEVVVCDGFVGNILIKFAESIYELLKSKTRLHMRNRPFAKLGALMMLPAIKKLKKDLDYQEYGGVPLLGVNGVSIIGHGHSSHIAIKNAIRVARRMVRGKINDHIQEKIEELNVNKPKVTMEAV